MAEYRKREKLPQGITIRSDIYSVWAGIKTRCNNKKRQEYKDYGGRGIKICKRWEDSFLNFYIDVGDVPKGMTLERIDNDGDYEPKNVRWATRTEQARNRRSSAFFTINGTKKCLSEWIEYYGLKSSTVRQRYYTYGWSIEKSLELRGY